MAILSRLSIVEARRGPGAAQAETRLMRNRHLRQDAGLVLLAIAVRAAAVLILQSHHVPRSTYEHGEIAANLLAGHGFSVRFLGAWGPTSQQAPIYPALVALAYAVGGAETPAALLTLELAQAILGGLLVLGVLRLAREAAHQRAVSIAAGLIAALHPTLVYAATHVQVSLLGATLLTWTLVCAFRTGASGGSASGANHWGLACGGDIVRPDPRAGRGGRSLGHCAGQVRSRAFPRRSSPACCPGRADGSGGGRALDRPQRPGSR